AYSGIETLEDLPQDLLRQIEHFFEQYKALEPGKWVKVEGWAGLETARQEILDSVKRYETE
ncbi:MAG: inorganic pyrophosphatase, partial [Gammaproteobacteria bacterium]